MNLIHGGTTQRGGKLANVEVGSAYVSVIPSMKGFNTKVMEGVFSGIKTAAMGVATAVGAMSVAATKAYADYEQLTGGVQKLFGDAYSSVMKNAQEAYKTAGVSMNEYMDQLNSFAASLKKSLGGDVQEAAKIGNMAIHDMADNASVFGTNLRDIQNAYQGFAKQNYTMLDNLKLGYGGTKQEMEKLIKHANELEKAQGRAGDLTIEKFGDVVKAIHDVQEEQGILGNSAQEASHTIQGSIDTMKAAWENWLVALADPNTDLSAMTQNLLDSVGSVIQNVAPRIQQVARTIFENLPTIASTALEALKPIVADTLASAWNSAGQALEGIGIKLPQVDASQILDTFEKIKTTVQNFGNDLKPAADAIGSFIQGIVDHQSELESAGATIATLAAGFGLLWAGQNVEQVATFIVNLTRIPQLLQAWQTATQALSAAQAAFNAIMAANPIGLIVAAIVAVVAGLVTLYNTNEGFRDMVNSVLQSCTEAWNNFVSFMSTVPEAIGGFFSGVGETIGGAFTGSAEQIQQVWDSAINLAQSAWDGFVSWISSIVQSIINAFQPIVQGISAFFQSAGSTVHSIWEGVCVFFAGTPMRIIGFFAGIVAGLSSPFQSACDSIRNTFDNVVSFISGIPGKIQGFFAGLQIRLPHIPLPHFSLSGSFSLMPPSVPHLSVSWYAKGGIFNSPSVIGVGEAGREAVLPIDRLTDFIPKPQDMEHSHEQDPRIDKVIALLAGILEKDTNVYMDTNKLSSGLYGHSRISALARGVA